MGQESRSASGKLELYYDWEESSSSHHETTNEAYLEGNKESVLLILKNEDWNIYKGGPKKHEEKYTIPVSSLINLIKINGTKA